MRLALDHKGIDSSGTRTAVGASGSARRALAPRGLTLCVVVASVFVLASCGKKGDAAKPTQVIAKVNDSELSIHQLNFALQGVQETSPEQIAKIRKATLDRMVEQESLVQDAIAKKVDRDPSVQQQLDAARKEILVRNHLQKIGSGAPAPTAEAIDKFYQNNPDLFKERNVFQFTEMTFPRTPANWAELEKVLLPTKTMQEVVEALRAKGYNLPVSQNIVRAAEDLPLDTVKQISKLKDGEIVIYGRPPGIVIAQIMARKSVPLDDAKAKPAIEKFLTNKARGELIQDQVKRVREAAKVTYLGEFAADAKPTAAAKPAEEKPGAKDSAKEVLDKGIKALK